MAGSTNYPANCEILLLSPSISSFSQDTSQFHVNYGVGVGGVTKCCLPANFRAKWSFYFYLFNNYFGIVNISQQGQNRRLQGGTRITPRKNFHCKVQPLIFLWKQVVLQEMSMDEDILSILSDNSLQHTTSHWG